MHDSGLRSVHNISNYLKCASMLYFIKWNRVQILRRECIRNCTYCIDYTFISRIQTNVRIHKRGGGGLGGGARTHYKLIRWDIFLLLQDQNIISLPVPVVEFVILSFMFLLNISVLFIIPLYLAIRFLTNRLALLPSISLETNNNCSLASSSGVERN